MTAMRRWWAQRDPITQLVLVMVGVSFVWLGVALAVAQVSEPAGVALSYLWILAVVFLCAGLSR